MADDRRENKINESVAGASVGSVYFGIVNVFPQHWTTQILLALTPVISVFIAFKWNTFFDKQRHEAASSEIENSLREATNLLASMRDDPAIFQQVLEDVQLAVDKIQTLKGQSLLDRAKKAAEQSD